MRKILFPIQKLCLVILYLEQMIEAPKIYFVVMSVMFLIGSIVFEGGRPYTPLIIIIAVLNWWDYKVLEIVLVVVVGLVMLLVGFYDINVPKKGPYNVGYKAHTINKVKMCVYYPTMQQNGEKTLWMSQNYMRTIYEIFYVHPATPRPPFSIFSFLISYLHTIQMPVFNNATLHPNLSEFSVLVWSHGLGANMHGYTSICCYWASHGRVVVSINHQNDEICLDYRPRTDLAQIERFLYGKRNRDIITRVQQMSAIINQTINAKLLDKLFGSEIAISKLYLGGHSFGGGTALQTSTQLKQIHVDGLILLDPWFFPLSESTYLTPINVTTLIINSHTFYQIVPQIYCLEDKLNRLKVSNQQTLNCLMVTNMDHLAQSDMGYTFGGLMKVTGSIKLHSKSDDLMKLNQQMIEMYVSGLEEDQIIKKANQFILTLGLHKVGVEVKKEWRFSRQENTQLKNKKQ